MYKKIINIWLISLCSFFIVEGSENHLILYQEADNKALCVYYNQNNILNFFLFDTNFNGEINNPKNISLLPDGNIMNIHIPATNLSQLVEKLYTDFAQNQKK